MSIPGYCFWSGGHSTGGSAHGEGTMTFFCEKTGDASSAQHITMCHGVVEASTTTQLPQDKALQPDVTATVAHLVDDEWLYEDGVGEAEEGKDGEQAAAKVRLKHERAADSARSRQRLILKNCPPPRNATRTSYIGASLPLLHACAY